MKQYAIIKPYESDESVISIHKQFFKDRDVTYGFLFKEGPNTTHLCIKAELEKHEALYLALVLNAQVTMIRSDYTEMDIISDSSEGFRMVAHFHIKNIEPIEVNLT